MKGTRRLDRRTLCNCARDRKTHSHTQRNQCKELQAFIRPLSVLLNGLKTGRYNKGLTSFQQSVAMDRIQRIVGVLQKPEMGERYLGTLLQVEMMLKVWFPHVTTATPSSTGSGPTETECSARKHTRTSSSGTSSSRNSSSPPSSPRQSCSDGSSGETSVAGAGRGQAGESEERPEEEEEEEEDEEQEGRPGSGPAWLEGQEDAASGLRCLPLVTQDSSISSTTRPRLSRTLPQPWDSFDLRESGRPSK
uniref:uncharacterized protein isoform X2 n=1 Tax=Pristiophorus japonicus TaxID=55135 RepID=UPI00398E6D4F